MDKSFVYDTAQKPNRILFYICLAGMLVLLAVLGLNWRYFYNFAFGPFSIDNATLSNLTDPTGRLEYFVNVVADDVADSGFQRVTDYSNGKKVVEANFPVLLVGQKVLLVETTATTISNKYTGALKTVPDQVNSDVIQPLVTQVPELKPMFLPYMLQASNFRMPGIIGLAAGVPVFILFLVGAIVASIRTGNPLHNPTLKALNRFGEMEDVMDEVDAEMEAEHLTVGSGHLLQNWLVLSSATRLQATKYADVVWFYKQVIANRVLGIPVKQTFAAILHDRHSTRLVFTGKEAEVDEFLAELGRRAPWAVKGFTEDKEEAWKNDPEAFISRVDERQPHTETMPQTEEISKQE